MGRRRDALVAVVIAITAGIAAASPAFGPLHGMSIDALTALRWFAFGPARAPATSPAVVVALDEETYRTPPFIGTPGVTWTREIGRVMTAVIEGGAKVVGFDVIFPTSIEQSEISFGDETLGTKLRGFDRDFLRALDAGLPEVVALHCLGGFVVAVRYGLSRPTADLDYLEVIPARHRVLLQELAGPRSALARAPGCTSST